MTFSFGEPSASGHQVPAGDLPVEASPPSPQGSAGADPPGPRRGPPRRSCPSGSFADVDAGAPPGPRRGPPRRSIQYLIGCWGALGWPPGPRRGPPRRSLASKRLVDHPSGPPGPRRGPPRRSIEHHRDRKPDCAHQVPAGDLPVEALGRRLRAPVSPRPPGPRRGPPRRSPWLIVGELTATQPPGPRRGPPRRSSTPDTNLPGRLSTTRSPPGTSP